MAEKTTDPAPDPSQDPGRIHRLLRLLTLVQTGRKLSTEGLMDELGVSRRTLFRDLKALRTADIPVYHQRGHGYRIRDTYYLPPVSLTAREMLGLLVMAKFATGRRARAMFGEALSGIFKLVTAVPEPTRSVCAEIMGHIEADAGPIIDAKAAKSEERVFVTLQECIAKRRACRFEYSAPAHEGVVRGELHPILLHEANRAWYVFARTSHAVASGAPQDAASWPIRMFKLIRFRELSAVGGPGAYEPPEHFTPRSVLGNAWSFIPEGKEYDIELEFEPRVATNVAEVRWHPSQQVERFDNGRARLRFRVDGLREISWWISGYGDQVRVLKPAALRRMVREMHARAAEMNRG